MINAKHELLQELTDLAPIKCALIQRKQFDDEQCEDVLVTIAVLPCNASEAEKSEFLNALDFIYDDGYGAQELFGTVWLTDGSWLERGEYDGSEWWEHKTCPEIPMECLG